MAEVWFVGEGKSWIPAFAGMTMEGRIKRSSAA